METLTVAYIGLGSNLGDRESNLRQALERLAHAPNLRVRHVTPFQQTKPVGPQDQSDFLNAAVEIETTLAPLDLLDLLQKIEQELGRVRTRRWGPRTIDLDILLYGDQSIQEPRLTVPHPEIPNRPFVQEALLKLGAKIN